MSMSSNPSDPKKPKDKPKDPKNPTPKDPPQPPQPKESEEAAIGILGYGLNLFDADPWNSPFKDKRILAAPIQTKRRDIRVTKYEDTYEDNFLDMTHTLAVESGLKGSYGDFSGSVTAKYTRTDRKIEKRHLQRISHSTHLYDLSLASSPSELKGKLEPKFKSDLETMPTGELLDLYGSHLVHKIKMGGRAEYFCQTADLTSMTDIEFKATAQAKYQSLGGKVQSKSSVGTVDKKKERLVLGSTYINAIGGSSGGIKDPDSWDAWAKSVPANPGFLGFDQDAGLVPIWLLTDNAARSKEIHEAYKRKAARAIRTEIFTATSDVASWPEATVTVPEGYKLLSGGARNNWNGRGSFVIGSYPEVTASHPAARSWAARGKDHLGKEHYGRYYDTVFPDETTITVFAIALYDPDDIWDVKHLYTQLDGYQNEYSWAHELDISGHPGANGGPMVGGGTRLIVDSVGQLLSESYPTNAATWRSHAEAHFWADNAPPKVGTYATVLKSKVEKIEVTAIITSKLSSPAKQPKTDCKVARDCVMTGGGARIDFGPRPAKYDWRMEDKKVLLTASFPSDIDTWEGRAKDHGVAYTKGTIEVYCVGVKVTERA